MLTLVIMLMCRDGTAHSAAAAAQRAGAHEAQEATSVVDCTSYQELVQALMSAA